ncbi:MAG: hypothetical protein WAW59_07350 [Patescibacteria group bacterium]
MASFFITIVPIPYCGCLTLSPVAKSQAEFFFPEDTFWTLHGVDLVIAGQF